MKLTLHVIMTLVCIIILPAAAQTVTYEFTGILDTVEDSHNLFHDAYVGQPFSGWFSYASDTDVTEIGSTAFTLGTFLSPVIDDRCFAPTSPPDQTYLNFYYYEIDGDIDYGRTGVRFNYSSPVFLSELPTDLDLSMFESAEYAISGYIIGQADSNFRLSGPLSTLILVPEPATVSLLALGGLALLRKRK